MDEATVRLRQLTPNGKPMRALRALAKTNPGEPLTEYGVWLVAHRDERDTAAWHSALRVLVARGLAARCGRPGGYEWYITDKGREALP